MDTQCDARTESTGARCKRGGNHWVLIHDRPHWYCAQHNEFNWEATDLFNRWDEYESLGWSYNGDYSNRGYWRLLFALFKPVAYDLPSRWVRSQ